MHDYVIQRVDEVEKQSFIQLYGAAEDWGTGWHTEHGVTAVWSAHDDDPSFSCVLDLAGSDRREETLHALETAARAAGAQVVGVDTHPNLDGWDHDMHFQRLGYQQDCEECIWALDMRNEHPAQQFPPGVEIVQATREHRDLFARILNTGWDLPEDAARGYVFAAGIGLENWKQYIAVVDDQPAGIAVLFVHDGVADCFLSATLPEYRGRGIQTALIERRLADGLEAGCTMATSQTVVHNASPRNMARRGFRQLYRRWIYGKRLRGEDAASIS